MDSWSDDETQIILDDDDVVADEVFNFIEEAVDQGEDTEGYPENCRMSSRMRTP